MQPTIIRGPHVTRHSDNAKPGVHACEPQQHRRRSQTNHRTRRDASERRERAKGTSKRYVKMELGDDDLDTSIDTIETIQQR
jgi:hypothetical protein